MKPSELEFLLQEGEGSMLEYKEGLSASFARELVAMANTAGGKILLGVRDDGTVKGIRDSNGLRARIQDIARNCDPPVKVLVKRVGEVTVVTVRESDAKPVQCSDGFFAAIFRPNPEVRAMVEAQQKSSGPQVDTKSAPSRYQVGAQSPTQSPTQSLDPVARLLVALQQGEASSGGLRRELGIKHRPTFRENYLHPALQAGFIERTIPDKPTSRLQRYRLTRAGIEHLQKIEEEK